MKVPAGITINFQNHEALDLPEDLEGVFRSFFRNEYGEQLIYTSDGVNDFVYHSDDNWQPRRVYGGLTTGLSLEQSEAYWLEACWLAAHPTVTKK